MRYEGVFTCSDTTFSFYSSFAWSLHSFLKYTNRRETHGSFRYYPFDNPHCGQFIGMALSIVLPGARGDPHSSKGAMAHLKGPPVDAASHSLHFTVVGWQLEKTETQSEDMVFYLLPQSAPNLKLSACFYLKPALYSLTFSCLPPLSRPHSSHNPFWNTAELVAISVSPPSLFPPPHPETLCLLLCAIGLLCLRPSSQLWGLLWGFRTQIPHQS